MALSLASLLCNSLNLQEWCSVPYVTDSVSIVYELSHVTEKRHTIACTMGAYGLLICSIIIDHSCLCLLETSIVVSRFRA